MNFLTQLFSGDGFIPRAQCGAWTPGLIWLHNVSDFFIWTAYLAIPIVLVKFAYKRRQELPFRQLFWLFGLFILACGTTHLMDIVLFYDPVYRLAGVIKLITAAASWGTVMALFHVAPRALAMRAPVDFEREIAQRREVENELQKEIEVRRLVEESLKAEIARRERSEAEAERFFNLSLDKQCVVSFDGFFKRLNPAWETSLGFNREELMAQPYTAFVHPDDLAETSSEIAGIQSGEVTEAFENRYRCKDGSYKWLSWRAKAVPEEQLIYASARDVTQNKIAGQFLQTTLQQIERSNTELQNFASIASHDLQEPLRAIQAFGDRLQGKYGASLGDEGRDYLTRMQNAAGRMRSLIQDLLAYSRVSTKTQPFEPTDLNATVAGVLTDLAVRLEETGGRVEVGELPTLDGDALQMRQLFQNLIANALKFHRADAPPVVKVFAQPPRVLAGEETQQNEETVEIVVEDNGIGFEEKFAERIFAPFERLHNQRAYSGTGIGLAICRKIAERHGGDIAVSSEVGRGSRFTITLPLRHVESLPDIAALPEAAPTLTGDAS